MEDQSTSYTDKVGLPPGSLVYIGEKRTQEVIISEINFSLDDYQEKQLNNFSDCTSWDNSDTVTVVGVIGIHDTSVIEAVSFFLVGKGTLSAFPRLEKG